MEESSRSSNSQYNNMIRSPSQSRTKLLSSSSSSVTTSDNGSNVTMVHIIHRIRSIIPLLFSFVLAYTFTLHQRALTSLTSSSNCNNNYNYDQYTYDSHLQQIEEMLYYDTHYTSSTTHTQKKSTTKRRPIRQQRQLNTRKMKTQQHYNNNNNNTILLPPLESLIDVKNEKITGDVNFLLDFAITGIAKCGTSTMMHWLASHTKEIQCFQKEQWALNKRKPHLLIEKLYNQFEDSVVYDNVNDNNKNTRQQQQQYKLGYKNPADIEQKHVRNYYRTIFPKTKLFIGIRHPVLWFESLYNFRIQNLGEKAYKMPRPIELIGPCADLKKRNCCTNRANFAEPLIQLGKQYLTYNTTTNKNNKNNQQQEIILKRRLPYEIEKEITSITSSSSSSDGSNDDDIIDNDITNIEPLPNPIFLFETEQLGDDNQTRSDIFREDVQDFLQLQYPLSPIIHFKPGKVHHTKVQEVIDSYKINICDDEFIPIRNELMKHAELSSIWIRDIFINSPTVYVSSKEYFIQLMEKWMIDPCSLRKQETSAAVQ